MSGNLVRFLGNGYFQKYLLVHVHVKSIDKSELTLNGDWKTENQANLKSIVCQNIAWWEV